MKRYRAITIHVTENFDENAYIRKRLEDEHYRRLYFKEHEEAPAGEHIISLIGIRYVDELDRKWTGHEVFEKPSLTEEEIESCVKNLMSKLDLQTDVYPLDQKPRNKNAVFSRYLNAKRLDELDTIAERKGMTGHAALYTAVDEYIERNK